VKITFFKILVVGAGGFIGASLRYVISLFTESKVLESGFPVGTFIVNMIGCFLIGLMLAIFDHNEWVNPEFRLFLFTGILGAFTTFSAFANDSLLLIQSDEFLYSLINISGQIIVGIMLVWLGYQVLRLFT